MAPDGCENQPRFLPAALRPRAALSLPSAATQRTGSGKWAAPSRSPPCFSGVAQHGRCWHQPQQHCRPRGLVAVSRGNPRFSRDLTLLRATPGCSHSSPPAGSFPGFPGGGEHLACSPQRTAAPPSDPSASPVSAAGPRPLSRGGEESARAKARGGAGAAALPTSCRRPPRRTTAPSTPRGRSAALRRPARPAAAAPSRWRRPGAAHASPLARTRTRTAAAAARRQRGCGRLSGTVPRSLRSGRSHAAVRVGASWALLSRRGGDGVSCRPLPARLGRALLQLLPPRGCPGGAGARRGHLSARCRCENRRASGVEEGFCGGRSAGPVADCAAATGGLLRGPEPLPARVVCYSPAAGKLPFRLMTVFPRRRAWIGLSFRHDSRAIKWHALEGGYRGSSSQVLRLLLLLPLSGGLKKDGLQPAQPSLRYFCFSFQT